MAQANGRQEEMGRFGDLDPEDPDLESVDTFVEACIADGVETFDWQHLACLAWNQKRDRSKIRAELEGYGLRFVERPNVRRIRTISSNPHDRWHGPGSCATHGGSGWEQIEGFAGRAG